MIEIATDIQNPDTKDGYDMIYLVICSLYGIVPEKSRVEQMNLIDLYRMAKYHSLTAIVCMALEATGVFSICQDAQLVRKWKDAKGKAIRKNMMLDAERKEILIFMEMKGIWYMPLKGILLKEMYPKIGMRQMADNDILYDKQYQKELLDFMISRAYKSSHIGEGNHDVYLKAPVYNYEFHTALYCTLQNDKWEEYYRNVKQRLKKDEDNSFGYHFSDEDFYVYITTHSYKHYSICGTGIRSLLDTYIFLKQKEAKLDWNYINYQLKELNITEFELESRELCKKLFSNKTYQLTQKESEILAYYLGSGTYGTMKNNIERRLRKYQPDNEPVTVVTKIKYYLGRLIPNMDYYKKYVPFVYRHKWIIPFYLVFRVVRGLTFNRKNLQKEIQLAHKIER